MGRTLLRVIVPAIVGRAEHKGLSSGHKEMASTDSLSGIVIVLLFAAATSLSEIRWHSERAKHNVWWDGKSGIPILRLYVICSISIELLYVKWFIAVLFNAVLREKTVVEFVELSIPLRARCKHRATWMRDVEHWRTVMP